MTRQLDAIAHRGKRTDVVAGAEVPPDRRDRLRALGYVGTTAIPAAQNLEDQPDPKDCIAALNRTLNRPPVVSRDSPRVPCQHADFRKSEEFRKDPYTPSR